ncbi:uncharacterized protein M6B38_332880 [Iris pallida]|uniref:Uncharacterized protein n=1 Tax=Iris pallida TaxID=29817 RepID=A0AAX6H206_IRIPA|nr:uncharacterized protein M6B38_332880 [Iris pallida]
MTSGTTRGADRRRGGLGIGTEMGRQCSGSRGQTQLRRRLPKSGFKNRSSLTFQVITGYLLVGSLISAGGLNFGNEMVHKVCFAMLERKLLLKEKNGRKAPNSSLQKFVEHNQWTSPYLDKDAQVVREDNDLKLEVAGLNSMEVKGLTLMRWST